MINPASSVAAIGHAMLQALASTFPVACTSDEFFTSIRCDFPNHNGAPGIASLRKLLQNLYTDYQPGKMNLTG